MQDTYNEIVKILNQLIRSCKDAMSLCQQWTYNGHKRYYQVACLCYMEKLLYLKKKAFDMFRFMPLDDSHSEPYIAQTYKDHFTRWEKYLKSCIDSLTELNKRLFTETGIENCTLTDIIEHLYKDQERTVRKIKQYNESGWNAIELHLDDKKLHEKMKKKMNNKGYK